MVVTMPVATLPPMLVWEDVKLCNCAECGKELMAQSTLDDIKHSRVRNPYTVFPEPVGGWIGETVVTDTRPIQKIGHRRPYCSQCLEPRSPEFSRLPPIGAGTPYSVRDAGSDWDNLVSAYEEDR